MTRARFEELLDACTAAAVGLARTMVSDVLPQPVRYQTFGRFGALTGVQMTKAAFVEQLWSAGTVPRWIDLSVATCTPEATIIGIWYSSDGVEDESACLYSSRGQGPFGIKSPIFPPDWESVEKSGRFSLNDRTANKSPDTTRGK